MISKEIPKAVEWMDYFDVCEEFSFKEVNFA